MSGVKTTTRRAKRTPIPKSELIPLIEAMKRYSVCPGNRNQAKQAFAEMGALVVWPHSPMRVNVRVVEQRIKEHTI